MSQLLQQVSPLDGDPIAHLLGDEQYLNTSEYLIRPFSIFFFACKSMTLQESTPGSGQEL